MSTKFKPEVQDPPVPAYVKFQTFGYIPLNIKLITEGDPAFLSPAGFMAAITLMAKSWQEIPATSLPDDDKLLANLAGFGRGPSAMADWEAVKDEALSDFILCSDGRFYSRSLTEKAMAAWESVGMNAKRTEAARKAKAQKRASATPTDVSSVTEDAAGLSQTPDKMRGDEMRSEDRRSEEMVGDVSGHDFEPADADAPF